ncbi:hypothetical protein, partial [Mycobacterium marinum]
MPSANRTGAATLAAGPGATCVAGRIAGAAHAAGTTLATAATEPSAALDRPAVAAVAAVTAVTAVTAVATAVSAYAARAARATEAAVNGGTAAEIADT